MKVFLQLTKKVRENKSRYSLRGLYLLLSFLILCSVQTFAQAPACTPTPSTNYDYYSRLAKVEQYGTTYSTTTPAPSSFYSDHSTTTVAQAAPGGGILFRLTIKDGNEKIVHVFIDWGNNGFTSGYGSYTSFGNKDIFVETTVSTSQPIGFYRMRLMIVYSDGSTDNSTPCYTNFKGSVYDYRVEITNTPVAVNIPSSPFAGCTNGGFAGSVNAPNDGLYGHSNSAWASGANITYYTMPGATVGRYYLFNGGCGYYTFTDNNGTIIAAGSPPLIVKIPASGYVLPYRIYMNKQSGCGGTPSATCGEMSIFNTGLDIMSSNPLPIELTSFMGKGLQDGNLLQWETASEKNNDYFMLESTLDGKTYNQIGIVKSSGNSTTNKEYEFLDRNPLGSTTYYRLSQVDLNGQSETFDPISIHRNSTSEIYVSPNPVKEVLHVSTEVKVAGEYTFSFVGINGQKLEQKHYLEQGNINFNLNTSDLAKGFYFLQIEDINGKVISNIKLVKE